MPFYDGGYWSDYSDGYGGYDSDDSHYDDPAVTKVGFYMRTNPNIQEVLRMCERGSNDTANEAGETISQWMRLCIQPKKLAAFCTQFGLKYLPNGDLRQKRIDAITGAINRWLNEGEGCCSAHPSQEIRPCDFPDCPCLIFDRRQGRSRHRKQHNKVCVVHAALFSGISPKEAHKAWAEFCQRCDTAEAQVLLAFAQERMHEIKADMEKNPHAAQMRMHNKLNSQASTLADEGYLQKAWSNTQGQFNTIDFDYFKALELEIKTALITSALGLRSKETQQLKCVLTAQIDRVNHILTNQGDVPFPLQVKFKAIVELFLWLKNGSDSVSDRHCHKPLYEAAINDVMPTLCDVINRATINPFAFMLDSAKLQSMQACFSSNEYGKVIELLYYKFAQGDVNIPKKDPAYGDEAVSTSRPLVHENSPNANNMIRGLIETIETQPEEHRLEKLVYLYLVCPSGYTQNAIAKELQNIDTNSQLQASCTDFLWEVMHRCNEILQNIGGLIEFCMATKSVTLDFDTFLGMRCTTGLYKPLMMPINSALGVFGYMKYLYTTLSSSNVFDSRIRTLASLMQSMPRMVDNPMFTRMEWCYQSLFREGSPLLRKLLEQEGETPKPAEILPMPHSVFAHIENTALLRAVDQLWYGADFKDQRWRHHMQELNYQQVTTGIHATCSDPTGESALERRHQMFSARATYIQNTGWNANVSIVTYEEVMARLAANTTMPNTTMPNTTMPAEEEV